MEFRGLSKNHKIKIYCFEPIPNIFSVPQKNELTNNPDFKVFENALEIEKKKKEFTYFPNSPALSTANLHMEKRSNMLINAVKGSLKMHQKFWAKLFHHF